MTAHQRNVSVSIDPVKLDRLAEVAVRVGLQLQPGQDLLLTAPSVALPLVRKIAEHAYKAGAGIVTPFLSDEEITLARYRYGHNESFDRAAGWLYEGMAKAFTANTARLAIVGDNPMLLSGEDPVKVARASKANSIAYQPALEKIVNFDTNWNIIAYPSPSWAKQVFPDVPEDVAVAKLADAIFAASRVDQDGAVAAWEKHNAVLRERTDWLNGQRFHALKYSGPGTDLTIGLADGHERHHLQRQHPDRGSLHHATLPARQRPCRLLKTAVLSGHPDRQHSGQVRGRPHRRGKSLARRGGIEESARHRRGRRPSRRSGAGAAFLADLQERAVVLQHPVRRERRLAHRARSVLLEMLCRRRQADPAADRGARRQQEPHSYRLDDWFGRNRHRRHSRRRKPRAGIPQGRVGVRRLQVGGTGWKLIA